MGKYWKIETKNIETHELLIIKSKLIDAFRE